MARDIIRIPAKDMQKKLCVAHYILRFAEFPSALVCLDQVSGRLSIDPGLACGLRGGGDFSWGNDLPISRRGENS